MPQRLGTTPGAGLVTRLRLSLNSALIEESVFILTLVEELVNETDYKVISKEVELMVVEKSFRWTNLYIISVFHLFMNVLVHSRSNIRFGENLDVKH